MNIFLSDQFASLATGETRLASFMLDEAKVSKTTMQGLLQKMQKSVLTSNFTADKPAINTLITADVFRGNLDQADLIIKEIYSAINYVSLITNSNIAVLLSDIKALERELDSLEKGIDNYAFLLSDGKAYDYAYLETFDDLGNLDNLNFVIPDRANTFFRQDQIADVNMEEGVLTMLPPMDQLLPVSTQASVTQPSGTGEEATLTFKSTPYVFPIQWGQVVGNNGGALVSTDTGIAKSYDSDPNYGWKLVVKSPQIMNQPLPEFVGLYDGANSAGLQVILEYGFQAPLPCDFINIKSFSTAPISIAQIRLYPEKDNEQTYKDVLVEPVSILNSRTISFPTQPVYKFRVFLRKEDYIRQSQSPDFGEIRYRRVTEEIAARPPEFTGGTGSLLAQSLFLNDKNHTDIPSSVYSASKPAINLAPKWGSLAETVGRLERRDFSEDAWDDSSQAANMFREVLQQTMDTDVLDTTIHFNPRRYSPPTAREVSVLGNTEAVASMTPTSPSPPRAKLPMYVETLTRTDYLYSFIIDNIAVGTAAQQGKAVFVSKPLEADGDVGEIRIKVSDENYFIPNKELEKNRDSNQLTSVEYSVSNISSPKEETDWTPIMPMGNNAVLAERLFVDAAGKSFTRFPMSFDGDIQIYKNGFKLQDLLKDLKITDFLIRVDGKRYYDSIRLPLGSFASTDIFTVDYVPAGDFSVIDFSSSFDTKPLMASFDANGAGEGFSGTTGTLEVELDNYPYVNYDEVSTSTYSATLGLTPYNPIVVKFDDGELAYNLTNYTGEEQTTLDSESDSYQYLHSGNVIRFNKAVSKPFKVYYKFLPSNIRFRAVLRCNNPVFVSPKVDYVQIKAKTRKPDLKKL